jgi:hypothetical protein
VSRFARQIRVPKRFRMALLSGARGPTHNEVVFARVINRSRYLVWATGKFGSAESLVVPQGFVRGCTGIPTRAPMWSSSGQHIVGNIQQLW